MRIGLFGGTFNPPHHGHIVGAQEARLRLELDEIWLLPTGDPPHREIEGDPGATARLSMCRLALIGQPAMAISTAELNRDGPSWTVDTLRELVSAQPTDAFTLVVGADQALSFGQWREPQAIGELADIAVAARAGSDYEQALAAVEAATGKRPATFEMPTIDISSTMIRERVARGETCAHLVPAGVTEFIEEAGLYR